MSEEDHSVIVLFDVEEDPSISAPSSVKMDHRQSVAKPGLPLVDSDIPCRCNTVDEHSNDEVDMQSELDLDMNTEDEVDIDDEVDTTLFNQCIYAAGSLFTMYQPILKFMRLNKGCEIRLFEERDNCKDTNAVAFQVQRDGAFHTFGYIPKVKIPKVKQALQNHQILKVSVHSIVAKYVPQEGKSCLYANCDILKRGKWGKDVTGYQYNYDMSK